MCAQPAVEAEPGWAKHKMRILQDFSSEPSSNLIRKRSHPRPQGPAPRLLPRDPCVSPKKAPRPVGNQAASLPLAHSPQKGEWREVGRLGLGLVPTLPALYFLLLGMAGYTREELIVYIGILDIVSATVWCCTFCIIFCAHHIARWKVRRARSRNEEDAEEVG